MGEHSILHQRWVVQEQKAKGMEELNAVLAELGLEPAATGGPSAVCPASPTSHNSPRSRMQLVHAASDAGARASLQIWPELHMDSAMCRGSPHALVDGVPEATKSATHAPAFPPGCLVLTFSARSTS